MAFYSGEKKSKQRFVYHKSFENENELIAFYDKSQIRPVVKKSNLVNGKKCSVRRKFLDCCIDKCSNYSKNKKPCFRIDIKNGSSSIKLYTSRNHLGIENILNQKLKEIGKIES